MWRERNSVVCGHARTMVWQVITNVNSKIREHKLVATNAIDDFCAWSPPSESRYCCNCDVAYDDGEMVAATIVRNDQGSIILIKIERRHTADPKIGEAFAVCMAAELMVEMKIERVIFQSDNIRVVEAF
ncbi:hypothetical protein G4B88_023216 [Cannabis sativa]|uniref:RNase H type-1 domain-containing protein n=2 Tax=Cannabis sativa TaxID=3483 RepID=A0A7J6DYH2_CANSA|nr:hypothetical protein G4B88_023216 [Cannabis sativa]